MYVLWATITCMCCRDFLQPLYSAVTELGSCSPTQLNSTLLPCVLDLLVSKYLGRADSNPTGARLPDHVPSELTTKMQ